MECFFTLMGARGWGGNAYRCVCEERCSLSVVKIVRYWISLSLSKCLWSLNGFLVLYFLSRTFFFFFFKAQKRK